jgi:hypothetical protein
MTTLFGSSRKNRLDENGFPIDEEVASPIGSLRNLFRTGSGSMQPKQLKNNEEEEAVSASRSKLMAHKGGVFGGQRIEQVQTNLVQADVVSDELAMRTTTNHSVAGAAFEEPPVRWLLPQLMRTQPALAQRAHGGGRHRHLRAAPYRGLIVQHARQVAARFLILRVQDTHHRSDILKWRIQQLHGRAASPC